MGKANFGVTRAASFKEIDSLFIGSSMFRQGIDIALVTPEGETAYLLAYNGNQPILELEEMRRFYELGGKARRLIVDMYAYSLAATPKLSDSRVLLDDTDGSYLLRLYAGLKKGGADWRIFYQMVFLTNNELLVTSPLTLKVVNRRYANGGNLGKREGATAEKLGRLPLLPSRTKPNADQVESLRELVQLCLDNGTSVYFVETPKYHRIIMESDSYIRAMEQYVNLVAGWPCEVLLHDKTLERMKHNGKVKLKNYSFDNTDASCYSDLIHLSSAGRRTFSLELQACLNK